METTFYYQDCLKSELSDRLNKNSRYSLRSFAKSLEVDAGDLSRIINGSKVLTPDLAKKILSKLTLSSTETQDFLFSIAKAYEDKGIKRKSSEVKSIIKKSKTKVARKDLSLDVFRVVSDWFHYAILQMIGSDEFIFDTKIISKQLDISELEVKLAIDRMLTLGLVKEENKTLVRTHEVLTSGDKSLTSSALRKRIKQVTEKSIYSLENDPIELRSHNTTTMAIDPAKIPQAKEIIEEFMDKMEQVLETKKKTVYELQINLFALQRGLNEKK